MTRAFLVVAAVAALVSLIVWAPQWAACGAVAQARPVVRQPSPYWKLERRFVDQQHAMGGLGAEVRRLRRSNSLLLARERVHARRVRTLQLSRTSGGLAETFRFFGWAFGVCIHGGEGSWTDPDAPYYGGVQMDWEFMQSYAPRDLLAKGTADHWTPIEQVAVAILGWSLRGQTFAPWPVTSRRCGLR